MTGVELVLDSSRDLEPLTDEPLPGLDLTLGLVLFL